MGGRGAALKEEKKLGPCGQNLTTTHRESIGGQNRLQLTDQQRNRKPQRHERDRVGTAHRIPQAALATGPTCRRAAPGRTRGCWYPHSSTNTDRDTHTRTSLQILTKLKGLHDPAILLPLPPKADTIQQNPATTPIPQHCRMDKQTCSVAS
jgi:hypothetical protein